MLRDLVITYYVLLIIGQNSMHSANLDRLDRLCHSPQMLSSRIDHYLEEGPPALQKKKGNALIRLRNLADNLS